MYDIDIPALNHRFSTRRDSHAVQIESGTGGLPVITVQNPLCCARIALQGAQVLSWVPRGEQEVIWVSQDACYEPGRPVRGGIPVCWPWFSAHDSRTDFPAHGFARSVFWQLEQVDLLPDGATRIGLSLQIPGAYRHMWPLATRLAYELVVGSSLQLALQTSNLDNRAFTISQALHTYFRVGDVSRVTLHGLEKTDYLDKLEGFRRHQQQGALTVQQGVDRIYLDTTVDCVIEDPLLQRNILVRKQGSQSTVVWNPWRDTAEKMGDLGPDGYLNMLCVESANAASDVVRISPGESHTLQVVYSL